MRYLGSGCSLQDLHFVYRIGRSTVSEIIRTVFIKIWEVMKDECIPKPTAETWKMISEGFAKRANFPNCLGAIDGKHIRVVKPGGSASLYYNYKHFFSIVLFAAADSNYRFLYVDVGSFGKESDSTVFKESSLWETMQNGTLQIPAPQTVDSIDIPMPFAFVGDEAFGLSTNVLRPYSGQHIERKKRIFNYRLSRARRYVECTFGILSNKWRIFHRSIDVSVDFAVDIVKCCCLLHNFVRERDGYNFDDTLTVNGLVDFNTGDNITVNRHVNRYRDALADYFVSQRGELPWQYDRL